MPWAVRFVASCTPRPASSLSARRAIRASCTRPCLEGLVLFAILWWMFWKTDARYQPGKLVGAFIFFYGLFRFGLEFIREPDAQLAGFAQMTRTCTWASGCRCR